MNTTPRPTGLTLEQLDQFYIEAAQTFIDEGWVPDDQDINEIISDLKRVNLFDSGYEIAKSLERSSLVCYEIDSECISYLDYLDCDKDELKTENIKQWVRETNPIPMYKVGDCVTVIHAINIEIQPSQVLWIHSIREDTAEYVASKKEKSNGGFIITYEKMEVNTCLVNPVKKCGNCDSYCECVLTGKKLEDNACDTFDGSYYLFEKNQEESN
ncbi:MAG: hypothetical protein RR346_11960 [Bacteroidales bacterium]